MAVSNYDVQKIQVACKTSSGTQDITIPGFGTPKAAMVIISGNTAEGVVVDNHVGQGATDGTNQWGVASWSEDASAFADSRSHQSNADFVVFNKPNTTAAWKASFSSWITDGIRIDWGTDFPDAGYLITVILFTGTDLNVKCDWVVATAATGSTGQSVGFQPNALIWSATHSSLDLGFVGDMQHFTGFATGSTTSITQNSQMLISFTGGASMSCASAYSSAQIAHDGLGNGRVVITEFTATGFKYTASSDTGNKHGFFALGISAGDGTIETLKFTVPATATTLNVPFTQYPMCAVTRAQKNTSDITGTPILVDVFGSATSVIDVSGVTCTAVCNEDAAADSNAKQVLSSNVVDIDYFSASARVDLATATGAISDSGLDLNFSEVDGASYLGAALAFTTGELAPLPSVGGLQGLTYSGSGMGFD